MKQWMMVVTAVAITLSVGHAAERKSPYLPLAPLARTPVLLDEQAKLLRRQLAALEKHRSLFRQLKKMKKSGKGLGSPLPRPLAGKPGWFRDEGRMDALK